LKDDRVYLRHILDCIGAIESYVGTDRALFLSDRKTTKAVLRELQELAESTQRLSDAAKASRSTIPWGAIAGFRNVLVHDYLGTNMTRVWRVIEQDMPTLKDAVVAILDELNSDANQP
jgi:uncharacterized protein with HEPN domain